MIWPVELEINAREWLGVPYLHQGRSRYGADCLGFIAACLAEMGSDVLLRALPANYARTPQGQLLEGLTRLCRQVDQQPGCILLLQFPIYDTPSHAAIYTGRSIIHSDALSRGVREVTLEGAWAKRVVSSWAAPLVKYT